MHVTSIKTYSVFTKNMKIIQKNLILIVFMVSFLHLKNSKKKNKIVVWKIFFIWTKFLTNRNIGFLLRSQGIGSMPPGAWSSSQIGSRSNSPAASPLTSPKLDSMPGAWPPSPVSYYLIYRFVNFNLFNFKLSEIK